MKLIINIPEDVYTRLFDNGIQDNEITIDDICEMARALRLGTPLEEELEKIKAEIQDLIDFEETCCGNTTLGYQCLGVINNRISELKGENK